MSRLFDRIFLFLYAMLLFVTPLLMFHRTSELFEFNKMLFIYLATFIVASLWGAKMILYKKIIIKKTVFDIPILLFLSSQILSTIFSIDQHTSIFGYYGRFNGGLISIFSYIVLYYGFISNINIDIDLKPIISLLKTSLISSVLVILWGLPGRLGYDLTCYLFTGVLNNNCWTEQFKPQERMFSTLGQPNWLGAYLAINFFIALYFLFGKIKNKSSISQFINFSISLIIFSAILFTRSRSALLAVVVGLILFALFDLLVLSKKTSLKIYLWFALSLFIPIIFFKTGVPKIDQFLSNPIRLIRPISPISPTSPKSSITGVTESGDIRKIVWQGAIDLGFKYPVFGTGVETFAYSYYFVRPKEHNLTSEWDFIYNKAHNEYLNYFATTGFFGLGSYLLFIFSVLFHFLKNLKSQISNLKTKSQNLKSNKDFQILDVDLRFDILHLSLLVAWIAILITNFFGFSTTTVNLYFYLLPAFLVSLVFPNLPNLPNLPSLKLWQKFFLLIPLLIGLIGLIFPISYFLADISYALADNYQKIQDYPQAYLYLNKALLYKNEHVYKDKLSNVLANLAFIADFEKSKNINTDQLIKSSDFYNLQSIKASPKNVLYWKTRAKNYFLFYQINENDKNSQQAIAALETAKTLSPTDPKIYYSQAMLYLNIDKEKALATINQAIELKPNYRDSYFAKGLILKQLNRKEEARKIFQYILEKLNSNDEEVKKELSSF